MAQQMIDIGFDENAYLAVNDDVASAVRQGHLQSGWAHFLLYGAREHRQGGPESIPPGLRKFLEVGQASPHTPPERLRTRVHGPGPLETWFTVGKTIAFDLLSAIERSNVTLPPEPRVLDFGCGAGRVIPWLGLLLPDGLLHGSDIDREAIKWCRAHLHDKGSFSLNDPDPPLPYQDSYFDVTIAISVFTHLPEEQQTAWLRELHRITKPNGRLFLSVQAERIIPSGFTADRSGHTYLKRGLTDGLPDFYRCAFHSEEYIRANWGPLFSDISVGTRAVNSHQDLIICTPKKTPRGAGHRSPFGQDAQDTT